MPAPSAPPLRLQTAAALRPMPLLRVPEPFDHPDWLFEVKHDGFRALAHIDGHSCDLVSRNGHTFKHWPQLCEELAHAIRAHDAVIDGEIVCLDARGRSNFMGSVGAADASARRAATHVGPRRPLASRANAVCTPRAAPTPLGSKMIRVLPGA